MAAILETVNRFRKIEEATAPKDDPAPVVGGIDSSKSPSTDVGALART